VSINTQAENDYVASLIQDASLYTAATSPPAVVNNYVGPYFGLQRLGSSGPTVGWQWLDGTPLKSTDALWLNWNLTAGQPDGMNGDNAALFTTETTVHPCRLWVSLAIQPSGQMSMIVELFWLVLMHPVQIPTSPTLS
jgi:hypothetical protein